MATFVVPKAPLALGPGTLLWAPPGTALPDYTVVASRFSVNSWTGWYLLGVTKEGHEFTDETTWEPIECAEYLSELTRVATKQTTMFSFELMKVDAATILRALNRPTPTQTGAGTTLRTTISSPDLGSEGFSMIGWQSTDDTERLVAANTLQTGTVKVPRQKGANPATLPLEYACFPDAAGKPYYWDLAGPARGALV